MITDKLNTTLGELALKHQATDDPKQKNFIFEQMEALFRDILKTFIKTYTEWQYETYEDYYQVALIAINNSIDRYDPQKGTYAHWFYHIAHFSICNNLKLLNAKIRSLPNLSLDQKYNESINPIKACISCMSDSPLHKVIVKDELDNLMKKLKNRLTKHQWKTLNAYIDCGLSSYLEAANRAGFEGTDEQKSKFVDNVMCNIRKIIKSSDFQLVKGIKERSQND